MSVIPSKMKGAILPGDSSVELRDFDVPKPGYGQVLVQTKATTICGSDIRCIYRQHVGKGPEGYIPGTIAGHEPCGIIVEEGEASLWKMEELVERLVRWGIHPEQLITHEFPLEKAAEAYALMAGGRCGKVAVTFPD